MDDSTASTAAETIWNLWQDGDVTEDLSADLKPTSRADGYAIQAKLGDLGGPLAGWKIAATSAAGQKHIGVDGPLAGRVFESRVREPGSTISIGRNRMRVAEPEFAFRLAEDIAPNEAAYPVDEVMSMVSDLHLAFELPDSRFADFASVGGPTLIADNACAHDLVVGPAVTSDWRAIDLSKHPVTGHVAGRIEREGSGANVLGDPRVALAWLVNELSSLGITLHAGELVTTGTSVMPLEIVEGDDLMADFGPLGQIQLYIAA